MSTTPTQQLSDAGVSIWLDDLSRGRLATGTLRKLIEEKNVVGVTTNPSHLPRRHHHRPRLRRHHRRPGRRRRRRRGDRLRDHHDRRRRRLRPVRPGRRRHQGRRRPRLHRGGPPPGLGHRRHHRRSQEPYKKVNKDNVLIKIPATLEGLEAITATLAEGISVNVTLIFSLERYRAVINAFQSGLEQAKDNGHDLSKIHSVASFFVSRVDAEIDKRLDAIGTDEAKALKGKAGLANARLAYQVYEELFSTERWALLADAGALPQRPLWASTGVKDPAYPDTLYVTELVAPGVVNTMPEKTLDATFDHGTVTGDTDHPRLRRRQRHAERPRRPRHLLQRRRRAARIRRPGQVRGQLEGTAGRRRGRPRRCTEGFLIPMSTLSYDATGAARQAHEQHLPAPAGRQSRHPDLRQGPHPVGSRRRSRRPSVRLGWVEAATVSQPLVRGHPGTP